MDSLKGLVLLTSSTSSMPILSQSPTASLASLTSSVVVSALQFLVDLVVPLSQVESWVDFSLVNDEVVFVLVGWSILEIGTCMEWIVL